MFILLMITDAAKQRPCHIKLRQPSVEKSFLSNRVGNGIIYSKEDNSRSPQREIYRIIFMGRVSFSL